MHVVEYTDGADTSGLYIRHNVYGPMIDLSTDVISQLKEGGLASFKFLAKPPKAYVCAIL